MIVANRVGDDCGFDHDDNAAEVFWRDGSHGFEKTSKVELARQIIRLVAERYAISMGDETRPELSIISSQRTKA
jgi:phosphopantothenoylcysteine decarboxylase/phosphopantothenate--cysteine ligase